MLSHSLVAVGAALASALLFLVSAQGSMAAGLVAYFTPLPIMIAALGWGHRLGLVAIAVASAVFLPSLSIFHVATYALAFGLPGWYLAYLALLARDGSRGSDEGRNAAAPTWYPIGHIVLWAAGMASLVVVVSLVASGAEADAPTRAAAVRVAALVHGALNSAASPSGQEVTAYAVLLARILPAATAASLTLLYLVNLWFSSRVVQLSGRLVRPWPNLPENLRLPLWAAALFFVAMALALVLPAGSKTYASVVATATGLALVLQALALAHVLSRKMRGRAAILAAVYVGVLLFVPFSLVALAAIGLADVVRPLARRGDAVTAADKGDPPAS